MKGAEMALTITGSLTTGGRHWEFTNGDVSYRLESLNGSDLVTLYWLHNGQPVPRGTRFTEGRAARSVAIAWAEEITGEKF
jgi:hypothetical protein